MISADELSEISRKNVEDYVDMTLKAIEARIKDEARWGRFELLHRALYGSNKYVPELEADKIKLTLIGQGYSVKVKNKMHFASDLSLKKYTLFKISWQKKLEISYLDSIIGELQKRRDELREEQLVKQLARI